MNCPTCGGPIAPGDVFCGNCGAQLGQQAAQATEQMPAAQQPTQQMPAQPGGPVGSGGNAMPPPPPAGGKGWIVVLVLLLGLSLCAIVGMGGWFFYISQIRDVVEETTATVEPTPTATATTTPSSGYATSEEAIQAELPVDWVYQLAADTPELAEYWAGPPASEWDTVYVVTRGADASWSITDSYEYATGLDDQAIVGGDAAQAQMIVEDFLYFIQNNEPTSAQALTVSPFADDPASAAYADGMFVSYTIQEVIDQGDGTYWVVSIEDWTNSTDRYEYHVVPTEAGWRINELVLIERQ